MMQPLSHVTQKWLEELQAELPFGEHFRFGVALQSLPIRANTESAEGKKRTFPLSPLNIVLVLA